MSREVACVHAKKNNNKKHEEIYEEDNVELLYLKICAKKC